jgi:superkiller protein 3
MLADRNGDKYHARGLFAHSVILSGGSLVSPRGYRDTSRRTDGAQLEADLAMAVATFEPFLGPQAPTSTSALHQPAFALRHYVHRRPTESAATHLYALICERLGLISEAAVSLESAVELLEQEFETSESTEIEHRYTIALLNLGRVRLANRAYDTSLEAFTSSFELLSGSQNPDAGLLRVQARVGQALAQYWLGQVDESLESFQQALDESSAQEDKETVAVLLARTLWGLGGDDAKELAKSQLMEWYVSLCCCLEGPHLLIILQSVIREPIHPGHFHIGSSSHHFLRL